MSELLPREDQIEWIVERGAALLDGGAEPVSGLVEPTGKFFPDDFEKSPKGVRKLLRRVVKLAGLTDFDIKPQLVDVEGGGGGGCSSGACGVGAGSATKDVRRVESRGDGWTVNVLSNELSNPVVLTTGLVRAVSLIFLEETGLTSVFSRKDGDAGIDLCGVSLGFGLLLCNGAYIYKKG